jgi:hypothetical protein
LRRQVTGLAPDTARLSPGTALEKLEEFLKYTKIHHSPLTFLLFYPMIRQSICLLLACSLTLFSRGQESELKRYQGADNQNGAENLNYSLNIHTLTYQLYLRLKKIADKIGYSNDHFVFPRPTPKK